MSEEIVNPGLGKRRGTSEYKKETLARRSSLCHPGEITSLPKLGSSSMKQGTGAPGDVLTVQHWASQDSVFMDVMSSSVFVPVKNITEKKLSKGIISFFYF